VFYLGKRFWGKPFCGEKPGGEIFQPGGCTNFPTKRRGGFIYIKKGGLSYKECVGVSLLRRNLGGTLSLKQEGDGRGENYMGGRDAIFGEEDFFQRGKGYGWG